MPEKSPEVWVPIIMVWISEHRGKLLSAGLAAGMALLRGMYSGGRHIQVMLDAVMCSVIAWFIKDALMMFGLDPGWTMLTSVFIGYMGTDYIGSVLQRVVGNKTGANK